MLSRVADSLYWMSRYLERAEHTARLIEVDLQLRLDQSPESGSGRWLRLLNALQTVSPEDGKIDAVAVTHLLTLERTNPSSLLSCVAAARENLRQVRSWNLTEEELSRCGNHKALGEVTLSELMATWAVHDLTHLHQISRILAHQYREAVGPWIKFLGVLKCDGHSAPV